MITISNRCKELEGREWKKVFLNRSMINDKQRLSLIDRVKISSILFLLILCTGVKWVLDSTYHNLLQFDLHTFLALAGFVKVTALISLKSNKNRKKITFRAQKRFILVRGYQCTENLQQKYHP